MRKLPGRKSYSKGLKVGLGVKDKGQGEAGEGMLQASKCVNK